MKTRVSKISHKSKQPEKAETGLPDVTWVKAVKTTAYLFRSFGREIDADIETTWSVVRNVKNHHQYSKDRITHQTKGIKKAEKIVFDVRPHGNRHLPYLEIADQHKILGLKRRLLCNSSERSHLLTPSLDHPDRTYSYIALQITGIVGFFTHLFYKKEVEKILNQFHGGIKKEAESLQRKKMYSRY